MSEALARRFHEAYERLAPSFGYETRADTRAFDPATANGRLMIAVCSEVMREQVVYAGLLAGLLREAVDHLAILSDGERDDPDVGIRGWDDCHRVVAEARAALAQAPEGAKTTGADGPAQSSGEVSQGPRPASGSNATAHAAPTNCVPPGGERAIIRLCDDGTLDEVVGRGVVGHLEQLDVDHWFLTIGDVAVWLHSKGKITASYERRDVEPSGEGRAEKLTPEGMLVAKMLDAYAPNWGGDIDGLTLQDWLVDCGLADSYPALTEEQIDHLAAHGHDMGDYDVGDGYTAFNDRAEWLRNELMRHEKRVASGGASAANTNQGD